MKHIIPIIGILVGIAYSLLPLKLMRARFLRVDFYLYTSVGFFIVVLLVG
jgi:hypothetical protein